MRFCFVTTPPHDGSETDDVTTVANRSKDPMGDSQRVPRGHKSGSWGWSPTPSSHTTVRTVPYTAVHERHSALRATCRKRLTLVSRYLGGSDAYLPGTLGHLSLHVCVSCVRRTQRHELGSSCSALHHTPCMAVGSEEAPTVARWLTSVRRSNRTCRFPASGFHEDALRREDSMEGIRPTRFTKPISPYSVARGRVSHPLQRQRL